MSSKENNMNIDDNTDDFESIPKPFTIDLTELGDDDLQHFVDELFNSNTGKDNDPTN